MLTKRRVFSVLVLVALAAWWMLSPRNLAQSSTLSSSAPSVMPLREAKPGDLVSVPEIELTKTPSIPLVKSDGHGPQFLFSDRPEYFRSGDGIAMQEDVKPGVVRLYVYHCPDPKGGKKIISAVIENRGV